VVCSEAARNANQAEEHRAHWGTMGILPAELSPDGRPDFFAKWNLIFGSGQETTSARINGGVIVTTTRNWKSVDYACVIKRIS
jgi:hypothetical protein